jgi:hypothetical protein
MLIHTARTTALRIEFGFCSSSSSSSSSSLLFQLRPASGLHEQASQAALEHNHSQACAAGRES